MHRPTAPRVSYTIKHLKNLEGERMSSFENALKELRAKRSQAQAEIDKLDQIISGIESLNGIGVSHNPAAGKRVISAASRGKMALAQKARWAGIRKGSISAANTTSSSPSRRTMSAAGRKRIAAAQRARWAKIRAGNQLNARQK